MHGATLVLFTLIIVSGLTMFYMLRTRHIERMTRIEHGMDEPYPTNSVMKNLGIFLCSIALGLFASYLVSKLLGIPDHIIIPGFLLLFGGGSLILIHQMDSKGQ